jgi:hypothetical protein
MCKLRKYVLLPVVTDPWLSLNGMARKRQHCESDNLESAKEPLYSVSLDGIVTGLLTVKKGKNSSFFDGSISDGTLKMRIVGFRTAQHKIMNEYLMKKLPIRLEECQIK